MGDSETTTTTPFCFSDLLCQEDHESCFNEKEDEEKPCFVSEDEDDYVQNMFKREEALFGSNKGSSFSNSSVSDGSSAMTRSWLKSARLDALEWIYNTRAFFGFHYKTAYLSITYFDRFLSKRYIDNGKMWAIRLLSVACLSLAAKMEECHPPMLSEFHVRDYNFESKVIQRTELLVLSALEWKMGSTTPFAYLNYFTDKFCSKSQRIVMSIAVELIVEMTKETNLIEIRPSIVAASAVLVASDGQLTRKTMELKMNVISFWRSEDKEDMHSCCNLLQEIGKRKATKTPPEFSFSPKELSMNSSFNSAQSTKRRLTFNECHDQSSPVEKVHRT